MAGACLANLHDRLGFQGKQMGDNKSYTAHPNVHNCGLESNLYCNIYNIGI